MKKIIYIVLGLLFISTVGYGQMREPSDPGNDPIGNDPLGGGAPIDGGTFILLGLAALYGGKKLYNSNKEELEE